MEPITALVAFFILIAGVNGAEGQKIDRQNGIDKTEQTDPSK